MQKITVLCVGKLKEPFYIDAAAEYEKRLRRSCELTVTELPEQRLPEDPSPAQIRQALALEAEAIRVRIPRGAFVTALCVEGKTCTSEELARSLSELAVTGQGHAVFLIGGSFGLDEALKRESQRRLSMSPMTFPHHMARIMLLEQLYRAYQIQSGTRYHK
ncbi:MAG: 23S rRNA (pseudouridine(1915)-N(3))-methyltransferase RlmH [Oscillospiraceae bacterium]|nr:23S rRNA (pseudouridine(1915)-N(3))-methyltransferase RlmH [Oscillospiraceae bacterium]